MDQIQLKAIRFQLLIDSLLYAVWENSWSSSVSIVVRSYVKNKWPPKDNIDKKIIIIIIIQKNYRTVLYFLQINQLVPVGLYGVNIQRKRILLFYLPFNGSFTTGQSVNWSHGTNINRIDSCLLLICEHLYHQCQILNTFDIICTIYGTDYNSLLLNPDRIPVVRIITRTYLWFENYFSIFWKSTYFWCESLTNKTKKRENTHMINVMFITCHSQKEIAVEMKRIEEMVLCMERTDQYCGYWDISLSR